MEETESETESEINYINYCQFETDVMCGFKLNLEESSDVMKRMEEKGWLTKYSWVNKKTVPLETELNNYDPIFENVSVAIVSPEDMYNPDNYWYHPIPKTSPYNFIIGLYIKKGITVDKLIDNYRNYPFYTSNSIVRLREFFQERLGLQINCINDKPALWTGFGFPDTMEFK